MRTKVTLVLLFLNVVVFFFVFWLTNHRPVVESKDGILGPAVVNIASLEISSPQRPTPTILQKRGETWMITQPVEWPANPFAVTSMLNELQQLRSDASFAVADLAKENRSLADYGLDKPGLSVTFASPKMDGMPEQRVTLRIGDTSKTGNRLYVLSPAGDRVHVVNRSLAESLTVPLETLRADTVFSIKVFEVKSLNLQSGPPSNLKVRIARMDSRWNFESPFSARANKNAIDMAIGRLNGLRLVSFVDARSPEGLKLTPEEMTLRVTLEGNNRGETLIIGGKLKEPPAAAKTRAADTEGNPEEAPPKDLEYYYAKMEEKPSVFVAAIPASLLTDLRNAQEELRERQILDVDPAAVTAITLAGANESELSLQRLETTNGSNSGPAWQIVRRGAERGPQTVPADREAVSRLIQHLCQLRAEEFAADSVTQSVLEEKGFNRPARTIRLTVANAATAQSAATSSNVVLQLGIGVDRKLYAKLEAPNYIYRVSDEILEQTPTAPLVYRERTVRNLPAGAKITGLKLVDLSNEAVLLDLPLPLPESAGGTVGTPPVSREAVESLAAQLRTVRAKRFVQGEFTKTVMVAGEDRPWKYQLTCTVALVGGNGAQTETFKLFFTERAGGNTQLVGASEDDVVFEAEQPLIDALFTIVYGPRDPGPTPPVQPETPAQTTPAPSTK